MTGIQGAGGNSAVNVRGGYADSAGNRAAGGATAIQGKNGYTAVNVRGGCSQRRQVRAGPQRPSAARAETPSPTAAGLRSSTASSSAARLGGPSTATSPIGTTSPPAGTLGIPAAGGRASGPSPPRPGPGPHGPSPAATAAARAKAVYYDYSQNVIYDQGTVYYGDQPVATAEQYYDEAAHLADAGQNTSDENGCRWASSPSWPKGKPPDRQARSIGRQQGRRDPRQLSGLVGRQAQSDYRQCRQANAARGHEDRGQQLARRGDGPL